MDPRLNASAPHQDHQHHHQHHHLQQQQHQHQHQHQQPPPPQSQQSPPGGPPPASFIQFQHQQPRPATEASSSSSASPPHAVPGDANFDLLGWSTAYQSCQRYFVNHAQHGGLAQAVASFINIRLPFQWHPAPITHVPSSPQPPPQHHSGGTSPSSSNYFSGPTQMFNQNYPQPQSHSGASGSGYGNYPPPSRGPGASSGHTPAPSLPFVSLIPYVRRLIVTGFDNEAILQGFFGSEWSAGIGPLREVERRNYMFAAKSVGWAKVKDQYDMGGGDETAPFMKPLQKVQLREIEAAEKSWSEWLAMEDWMVGPRAPSTRDEYFKQQDSRSREESVMRE